LADEIRALPQLRHVALPLGTVRRTNLAVAAMIEDEARARAGVHQLHGIRQFTRSNADVETQTDLAQKSNSIHEVLFQAIARRRGINMNYLTNALDVPAPLKLASILPEAPVGRMPANDRGNHRRLAGLTQFHDVVGLGLLLGTRHINFHVDRFDNVESL